GLTERLVFSESPSRSLGQPLDDAGRLFALRATGLLDSPAEPVFDRFAELIRGALRSDIAMVSLVDDHRQFFKSQTGLSEPLCSIRGTSLNKSLCRHVVTDGAPLRINDTRVHPLGHLNPEIPESGVIAYLGTPLVTEDGYVLGSLCAVCRTERDWSDNDLDVLRAVADSVMSEIRWRAASHVIRESLESREAAERSRDDLVYSLIHDMRTPVSAVISSLDLLKEELSLNDEQTEIFGLADSTAHELLDMLNGLLAANRLEGGDSRPDRTPVSVFRLLHEAFHLVKPIADTAGQRLTVAYPEYDRPVLADRQLINRVLINFLTNAIKFCPPGSTIAVSARNGTDSVQFEVRDNGPGIPCEDRSRIFEKHERGPAWTASPSFGLGLDFCRRTVAAHGGTVKLEDGPDGGCVFSFELAAAGR
ncbi:MAG TPA: GAF domain-containing sensor histidine kinase, partial [Terrimicrobiaceae bacterium]|nr:GAF domain-containing sensor histidine kinase [Terrimicrobiaceae bacterium]